MSDVEVKRWENELLKISLWVIRVGKDFWFFGKEITLSLEYTDPKDAIQNHVDPEDKMGIKELLGDNYKMILIENFFRGGKNPPLTFFQKLQGSQKVINEYGFLSLCTKSRKEKVKPFQKWVYKTIKEIRETGSYTLPQNLTIDNPLDLVDKVSTLEKRIQSLKKETFEKGIQTFKKRTLEKGTQTRQSNKDTRDSLKKLKNKIEKSIKKIEFELERSLREISSSSSSYSSSSRRSSSSDE